MCMCVFNFFLVLFFFFFNSISSTISYLPHLSQFSEMRRWKLAFSLPYQFTIENADVYYFLLGVWFYLLAFTKPCI